MLYFSDRAWEEFRRLVDAGHFGRVAVFSDDHTNDVRKGQRQTNVPVRVLQYTRILCTRHTLMDRKGEEKWVVELPVCAWTALYSWPELCPECVFIKS
jgi:hypothetical protein